MNSITSLSKTQIKTWIRSRSYASSVTAGIALIIGSSILNETAGVESYRILTDFGLLFCATSCTFIGIFFAISSLTSPEEVMLLQQAAVLPIRRSSILLSRAIAALSVVLLSMFIVTVALFAVCLVVGIPHPYRIFVGSLFALQEPLLAVGLALAAASASSRSVASSVVIAAYGLFRVGVPAADLRSGLTVLRYLPRFDRFSLAEWVNGGALPDDAEFRVCYTTAIFVTLIAIAVVRFTDRDLGAR